MIAGSMVICQQWQQTIGYTNGEIKRQLIHLLNNPQSGYCSVGYFETKLACEAVATTVRAYCKAARRPMERIGLRYCPANLRWDGDTLRYVLRLRIRYTAK